MTDASADPREVLDKEFPELLVETIEPIGDGWDHVAYLVNDEVVFRLPRRLDGSVPRLDARPEVLLLSALQGRLPS